MQAAKFCQTSYFLIIDIDLCSFGIHSNIPSSCVRQAIALTALDYLLY